MNKTDLLQLPDTEEVICTAKDLKDLVREVEFEQIEKHAHDVVRVLVQKLGGQVRIYMSDLLDINEELMVVDHLEDNSKTIVLNERTIPQ